MIDRDVLDEYSRAIDVELDDNALSRFSVYAGELIGTNRRHNLTAITDPEEVTVKHFIDSLMLLKYFDLDYGMTIIDIGSGAGFPGIPLLIAKNNKLRLTMVDSTKKKTEFLKNALYRCGLEAQVIHGRAEELSHDDALREKFDVATARAVAPLNELCELCLPFVRKGGHFIALKGSQDELSEALGAIRELGGEVESDVSYKLPNEDSRSIIIIKKISQTSSQYPRKYKKITSRPL